MKILKGNVMINYKNLLKKYMNNVGYDFSYHIPDVCNININDPRSLYFISQEEVDALESIVKEIEHDSKIKKDNKIKKINWDFLEENCCDNGCSTNVSNMLDQYCELLNEPCNVQVCPKWKDLKDVK